MLGLAAAVDWLRREGVAGERVLLIGGAAASQAVRAVAPDLLGVPVHVPTTAEYVALGAARQAAVTLLGSTLPSWEVRTDAVHEPSGAAGWADDARGRYATLLRERHGIPS